MRSCPTVWAKCSKPRQGRCHKHRHQNPRILTQVSHQHHAQVLDWDFANISFYKLKGCRRHHHVTIISSSLASPLCFLCVITSLIASVLLCACVSVSLCVRVASSRMEGGIARRCAQILQRNRASQREAHPSRRRRDSKEKKGGHVS